MVDCWVRTSPVVGIHIGIGRGPLLLTQVVAKATSGKFPDIPEGSASANDH